MSNPKKNFRKGPYNIKNVGKYMGKTLPMCRSSWEFSFCSYCDVTENIVKWASEPFAISYYDPVQHKTRKYFIDFYLETKAGERYIVEVKPHRETRPPRKGKNKSKKTLLYEQNMWETNQAKWKAAQKWAENKGMVFKIITEKQLFG